MTEELIQSAPDKTDTLEFFTEIVYSSDMASTPKKNGGLRWNPPDWLKMGLSVVVSCAGAAWVVGTILLPMQVENKVNSAFDARKLSPETIPNIQASLEKITKSVGDIEKNVTALTERLGGYDNRLKSVEQRVEGAFSKMVERLMRGAVLQQPDDAKRTLATAGVLLQAGKDESVLMPAAFFERASGPMSTLLQSKEISREAWSFALKLLSYRSSLPPTAAEVSGQRLMIRPIGKRDPLNKIYLDGYAYRRMIIKEFTVVYRGGPLALDDVDFIDCGFEIDPTPNGRHFVDVYLRATEKRQANLLISAAQTKPYQPPQSNP